MTSRRGPAPGAMSVVEYRNARLDDADVRVLGPARVSVAASVRADHPLAGDPLALRPSAVIVGGDPVLLVRERAPFTVMCGPSGSITVALWLPEAMVVVRCKRLLLESVVDSWIEKVLEGDPDSSLISEGNADDVDSGPPETQTLEAS